MCERRYRKDAAHCGSFTFLAMIVPVAMCRTLLTVPPFPWPRSLKTSRSSLFRSSLYSIPISSCAVCLVLSLPTPPGIWRSLSEGATARGAGAAKASPFTFFRFRVRTAPMFSDILGYWSAHRTRAEDLRAGRRGQAPPTRGRCRGDTIAVEAGCRSRSSGVSISGPSQRAASLLSVEMGEPRQRARGSVGVSAAGKCRVERYRKALTRERDATLQRAETSVGWEDELGGGQSRRTKKRERAQRYRTREQAGRSRTLLTRCKRGFL
jgi:hypothetical protein